MAQTFYDNQSLRRYLLGLSSEGEAAQLDELSLTDDECALALAQAENDLVDDYAQANLVAAERAQFERHYLASPARLAKAQFAREFQHLPLVITDAPRRAVAQVTEKASWFDWFKLNSWAQAGWAAATVLLLAGCVWLGWENYRLRQASEAERLAATQREAERPAALPRINQPTQTEPTPLTQATPLPIVPAAQLFTFTLAAPVRGVNELPAIAIPADSTTVSVRLELEANDYPHYRAALRDPLTNRIIWQSGKLAAGRSKTGAIVTARLPARLFSTQRYAFELSGLTAGNAEERLSSYLFIVVTIARP